MKWEPDRVERRRAFRIIYLPDERPVVRTIDAVFEVLDLSTEGLRLLLPQRKVMPGSLAGRLFLPTGGNLHVDGRVFKKRTNDPGVYLRCVITPTVVTAEKNRVSI